MRVVPREFGIPLLLALLALLATAPLAAVQPSVADVPTAPSSNAGRAGKYRVELKDHRGYAYWVQVPPSYSPSNPAGIHLFFHGQGGQGGAEWFGQWEGPLLNAHTLIGINMQYMDGDNAADTAGKVAAARAAIAQVMLDYQVLVGKGVVSSFSGGGLPHALFASQASKTRGAAWPFCHVSLYGSNYRADAAMGCPMSWYIGVGADEWNLAALGPDGCARTGELLQALARGGCPDIRFKSILGKGHTIVDEDVSAAAAGFARAELAFAPFLYAPGFPDRELKSAVAACEALRLGPALAAAEKAAAKAEGDLKSRATALADAVQRRAARVLAMGKRLCDEDPVLANHWLPIYLQQLKGLPAEKELKEAMQAAVKAKGFQAALGAHAAFAKGWPGWVAGNGSSPAAATDKIPALLELRGALPATSQAGMMVTDLLKLSGK